MTDDTIPMPGPTLFWRRNENPADLGQPVLTKRGVLDTCARWGVETVIESADSKDWARSLAATASFMGLVMATFLFVIAAKGDAPWWSPLCPAVVVWLGVPFAGWLFALLFPRE